MTALAYFALVVVPALLVRQHASDALQAHHEMQQHQAAELDAVDQLETPP